MRRRGKGNKKQRNPHVNRYEGTVGKKQRLKTKGSYVPKGRHAESSSKASSYTPPKELSSRRFRVTRSTFPSTVYEAGSIDPETKIARVTLSLEGAYPYYEVKFRFGDYKTYNDLVNVPTRHLPMRFQENSEGLRGELREVEGLIFKMRNEYSD